MFPRQPTWKAAPLLSSQLLHSSHARAHHTTFIAGENGKSRNHYQRMSPFPETAAVRHRVIKQEDNSVNGSGLHERSRALDVPGYELRTTAHLLLVTSYDSYCSTPNNICNGWIPCRREETNIFVHQVPLLVRRGPQPGTWVIITAGTT